MLVEYYACFEMISNLMPLQYPPFCTKSATLLVKSRDVGI